MSRYLHQYVEQLTRRPSNGFHVKHHHFYPPSGTAGALGGSSRCRPLPQLVPEPALEASRPPCRVLEEHTTTLHRHRRARDIWTHGTGVHEEPSRMSGLSSIPVAVNQICSRSLARRPNFPAWAMPCPGRCVRLNPRTPASGRPVPNAVPGRGIYARPSTAPGPASNPRSPSQCPTITTSAGNAATLSRRVEREPTSAENYIVVHGAKALHRTVCCVPHARHEKVSTFHPGKLLLGTKHLAREIALS